VENNHKAEVRSTSYINFTVKHNKCRPEIEHVLVMIIVLRILPHCKEGMVVLVSGSNGHGKQPLTEIPKKRIFGKI